MKSSSWNLFFVPVMLALGIRCSWSDCTAELPVSCTEESDLNKPCTQACEDEDECRCIPLPDINCDNDACLFPTCVPKSGTTIRYGDCTNVHVTNCNRTSDLNSLCAQKCEEQDECRCLPIPNMACDNASCLFPTCVPKNDENSVI